MSSRLLRITQPKEQESLISFLFRLQKLNGDIDIDDVIDEICPRAKGVYWRRRWLILINLSRAEIKALSLLTGCSKERLIAMAPTDHCEKRIEDRQTWCCPRCLKEKEGVYLRRSWFDERFYLCLRHHQLLVSRCPHCNLPILAKRLMEDCQCDRCGFNLMLSPLPRRISANSLGIDAQKLMIMNMKGEVPPLLSQATRQHLPSGWSMATVRKCMKFLVKEFSDSTLFAFAATFSDLSHQGKNASTPRCYSAAHTEYLRGAAALRALLDWPYGYYDLLDMAYPHHQFYEFGWPVEEKKKSTTYYLDGKYWWRPDDSGVLAEAGRAYHDSNYDPYDRPGPNVPLAHMKLISDNSFAVALHTASRALQIPIQGARWLVHSGKLRALQYDVKLGVISSTLVSSADVYALQANWKKPLSLEETAKWIKVSVEDVRELVRLGLLPASLQPQTGDPSIPKSGIIQIMVVFGSLKRWPMSGEKQRCRLRSAIRRFGYLGLHLGDALVYILTNCEQHDTIAFVAVEYLFDFDHFKDKKFNGIDSLILDPKDLYYWYLNQHQLIDTDGVASLESIRKSGFINHSPKH